MCSCEGAFNGVTDKGALLGTDLDEICPFVGLVGGGTAEVDFGGDIGGGCDFGTLTEGVICEGSGVGRSGCRGGGGGFGDSERTDTVEKCGGGIGSAVL